MYELSGREPGMGYGRPPGSKMSFFMPLLAIQCGLVSLIIYFSWFHGGIFFTLCVWIILFAIGAYCSVVDAVETYSRLDAGRCRRCEFNNPISWWSK